MFTSLSLLSTDGRREHGVCDEVPATFVFHSIRLVNLGSRVGLVEVKVVFSREEGEEPVTMCLD